MDGMVTALIAEEFNPMRLAASNDEGERQLTTFADSIPALAWMANGDGWIFWFNRRWYEYTGTCQAEMEGLGWQTVHDPMILPQVLDRYRHSIASGEPFEMVFPLRGADGVYRSFLTRMTPAKDSAGRVTRWFGTNTEIDELQRTRTALEQSEAQSRQLAESLPQLVWVTRPDGFVEWYNRRWYEYTGSTEVESTGRTWQKFFHPDDQERAGAAWQHSVDTGEPYNVEYRCLRFDGEYRWFLGSALPLRDAEGSIVRWFGTCTDIHLRKEAETSLLQNEKLAAVGRLASSIAHEINNPLESVTNLVYLARLSEDLADVREYLDAAERELRRVSVITGQTLRFHRQATNPTEVTCDDLFESVLSMHHARFLNSRVHVERRKRTDRPALCFEGEIRQVLNNLIANAIDALHPTGGRLLIRSRVGTNWSTGKSGLILTVADTGTGMSRAVQKKIFDAFYTTKGIGGTGLGLWVSRQILDRHAGSLHVKTSQREGCSGTVFTVFLPFEAAFR